MKANFIHQFITNGHGAPQKVLIFKPGQILQGKAVKLFPNNIAALEIRGQKVAAQLEAPLEAGKSYWFEVLPGEGKPYLKVLVHAGRMEEAPHGALLKQLSLAPTEENKELIRFLIKEGLPMKKQLFHLLHEMGSSFKGIPDEAEVIKLLLNKELPLTKPVFQAIRAVLGNESVSDLLGRLSAHLRQSDVSETGKRLLNVIDEIYQYHSSGESLVNQAEIKEAAQAAKSLAHPSLFVQLLKLQGRLGLDYEQGLVNEAKVLQEGFEANYETLKPLLMKLLQEKPAGILRDSAETLVNKITGLQLLAIESGPIQQLALEIPFMLGEKMVDVTMHWSGQKRKDGKIDPAFCRVLFYVELESLKETIVDMQVQARIIRLVVMNEQKDVKSYAAPFIAELRKNLEALNFTLSAVQFVSFAEEQANAFRKPGAALFDKDQYTGVDIRI